MHACLFVIDVIDNLISRKQRLDKIREHRWENGNQLSEKEKDIMSKEEVKFFQQYDHILNSYMQHTGFDLTAVHTMICYNPRMYIRLEACMLK